MIFALAQEEADEVAGLDREEGNLWAALLQDGSEVARRARELIEAGQTDVSLNAIDSDDWAAVEQAAGLIVMRDNEGAIAVQPYGTEENLAAAWAAMMADLEPGEPGSPSVRSPEADDNPT
ncbi:MAG: hypothetical protein ACRDGN_00335 [bacterium]